MSSTARANFALLPLVLAVGSAGAGASTGAARKPLALTAAPARVVLAGSTVAAVRVTNFGAERIVVDVAHAGFALSLRGRPRIVHGRAPRSAEPWLHLQPAKLVLPARSSASLHVSATVPRRAEPGDHDALVLLTTRPHAGAKLAVRVRLGVVVIVRAPGRVVRGLALGRLSIVRQRRRRLLQVSVVNRGNVTETLAGVRATLSRTRTGRRLETEVAPRRELRPRTRGILEFELRRRVRGAVFARLVVPAFRGRNTIRRTYRLRL